MMVVYGMPLITAFARNYGMTIEKIGTRYSLVKGTHRTPLSCRPLFRRLVSVIIDDKRTKASK